MRIASQPMVQWHQGRVARGLAGLMATFAILLAATVF